MKTRFFAGLSVIVMGLSGVWLAQPRDATEFIVAPKALSHKKLSVNEIKENIGKTTKQAFEHSTLVAQHVGMLQHLIADVHCAVQDQQPSVLKKMMTANAAYHRACGTLHQHLAVLQRKCSRIIEKLIDNEVPFKKASRGTLEATLQHLTAAQGTMQSCADKVQNFCNTASKSQQTGDQCHASLCKATQLLEEQTTLLKTSLTALNDDECLKNT